MRAGVSALLLLAPWVLLTLWILYVIGPASILRADENGVVVQNLLRRTSFGWARVRDIDMRWQLVFSLDDGSEVVSFGGPARARPRRTSSSVVPGDGGASVRVPPGYRELADLRERWEQADASSDAPIRRSGDALALCVLAAILIWSAAAIFAAYA